MEVKFVIVKNKLGNMQHLKSDWKHHFTIARDNGFCEKDIIECGVFLDKTMFILDCTSQKHLEKHKKQYVGNALNEYQDMRMQNWLKGRELESMLYYSKKSVGLRDGD